MDAESLSRPEAKSIVMAEKVLKRLAHSRYASTLLLLLSELGIADDDFDDSLDQMHHMSEHIKQK